MSHPVAWRRLEHGRERWGVLWIQVHRHGALWRVTLEEDGAPDAQALFHGAGPARSVAMVANQAIEDCQRGGWRIVTGSDVGRIHPGEILPAPIDTTPVSTLGEALFS